MNSDFVLNRQIWVYGSGSFASSMISQLEYLGHEILGVLDHQNLGLVVQGRNEEYQVKNFSEVEIPNQAQLVLAICNLHGDLNGISSQLSKNIHIVTPVKLFKYFSQKGLSLENYWLTTNFGIYLESHDEIVEFRKNLSDQHSKDLLDSILHYRQFGELLDLPVPRPLTEQYLAVDLGTPPRNLMVIDLGACRGENLTDFITAGFSFSGGYLFEPDADNLTVLTDRLNTLGLKSLSTNKLGAWRETTSLGFDASGNTGASLDLDSANVIDVVALDDFIPTDFVPNFIKMDIEGAELEALEGMVGLIQRHSPHLAVSVYHKPSHLWTLGNFLSRKFPEKYDYFLRVYGHQTFDTLMYAVPRK